MMQEWANSAIETAKRRGASYADVRVMDVRHRDISTKNAEVGTLAESESLGIGIRVIASGAWGFASTDRLTREGVQACAAEAVAIAKASALAKREDIALAPEEAHVDTWQNPFLKDPFRIPVERQIDLLLTADKEMRCVKGVTVAASSSFSFQVPGPRFTRSRCSPVRGLSPHVLREPKSRSGRIRIVLAASTCCKATS
jgi:TldD protein